MKALHKKWKKLALSKFGHTSIVPRLRAPPKTNLFERVLVTEFSHILIWLRRWLNYNF